MHSMIDPLVALARDAGRAILEVYATDFGVHSKEDASPVTDADLAANDCIIAGLRALTPELPIISEESGLPPYEVRSEWSRYWLIDPLDGTREFVDRNGEFTVNIALIDRQRPVLGVVHVPVLDRTYTGCEGVGAARRDRDNEAIRIQVTERSAATVRVLGSRSHRDTSLDGYLASLGKHDFVGMGSSLKFCVIAEGGADVYPRLGPTSEWDTAAAQAVVEQAGGSVVTLDGKPMKYNAKAHILNPYFMVSGANDHDWLAHIPNSE